MPRVLTVHGETSGAKIRPFLAVAAYSGLDATCAASLWQSQIALHQARMPTTLEIVTEHCHVDDSRNILVRDFLETDCTDLIFLDADVGWAGENIVELLVVDRDIVAGIYPFKENNAGFPIRMLPGELRAEQDGCVEVLGVPTGFLRIRRAVLEKLERAAKKFKDGKDDAARRPVPLIFERVLEDGVRYGGDYAFCRKAVNASYKIHVLPELSFDHVGSYVWHGSLGHYWRQQHGVYEMRYKAGFDELKSGVVTDAGIEAILDHWGNKPWAAGFALVSAWAKLAKEHGGPILECGAGITTLVAAAVNPANQVYALEHDFEWSLRIKKAIKVLGLTNIHIIDTVLKDGWYVVPEDMPRDFDLVLVDGPPRWEADRSKIMDASLNISAATVVFDDIDHESMVRLVNDFAERHGTSVKIITHPSKNFAVVSSPATTEISTAA